jgi:DMSO/TMAO reductase YedYZ molybdopterin-dependent catalytic subunit
MKKVFRSAVFLALVALLWGALGLNVFGAGTKTLDPVEVREYKGEKLGSSDDFRENSIKGPQHIDIAKYQLTINGLVANPEKLTYQQLLALPGYRKVVTLNCVEGWSVKVLWEGFLVKDILEASGIDPKAKVAFFYAADGYTTSLPLDYLSKNKIILAYKMNDVTLKPERGFPLQLVAEEKWGYKWIKWVTRIELSDNVNYKGYWESRGYSSGGGLDQGFLK